MARLAALFLALIGSAAIAQDVTRPEARNFSTQAISTRTTPITLPTRPIARPATVAAFAPADVILSAALRPKARPVQHAGLDFFGISPRAPETSRHPTLRPAAFATQAAERRQAALRGQVCGNPQIQGKVIGRVNGRGACGIAQAVQVRAVSGVTLSPPATIDCRTAGALNTWVRNTARPAMADIGGGMASMRVVSHYACRNRNSAASGRLSEHAFGRAIDIAAIRTQSGQDITLLRDWGKGAAGTALRKMWRGACGPFGTVLGPEANRFHRDHFHFDTARYRSGSYCR